MHENGAVQIFSEESTCLFIAPQLPSIRQDVPQYLFIAAIIGAYGHLCTSVYTSPHFVVSFFHEGAMSSIARSAFDPRMRCTPLGVMTVYSAAYSMITK